MTDAVGKSRSTARWAETMMRWTATFAKARRWQMVSFRGPGGQESRGVVDLVAIRRDYREPADEALKRGDLFEIMLIQIKGGGAARPSEADKERLLRVKRKYGAAHGVLFSWKKGKEKRFAVLGRDRGWHEVEPEELFA